MPVELSIPEVHPSLNQWTHWHWTRVQREHDRWAWLVRAAIKKPRMATEPVSVTVTYFMPDRRARDFDNYTPKFILDGLKGLVIPDDSSKWITDLRIRFNHDPKNPRTHVLIS